MTTGAAGTLSAADDTDQELLLRTQSDDRDRAEAEDLVQDIFLKLFAAKQGFEPDKGGARTWIVQFIYRRAFDRRAFLTRRHFYAGNNPGNAKSTGDEGPP
jgi:DNA-directed RNA polymerase specialized sigma24 family protein